jgi:hypothetical protein
MYCRSSPPVCQYDLGCPLPPLESGGELGLPETDVGPVQRNIKLFLEGIPTRHCQSQVPQRILIQSHLERLESLAHSQTLQSPQNGFL